MKSALPHAHRSLVLGLMLLLTGACAARSGPVGAPVSQEPVPGGGMGAPAAVAPQVMPPIERIGLYLDGFHFASHDLGDQGEAHHYCSELTAEVLQCVLYDADHETARLIGIEYVISRRLFERLPAEEKMLWHSHHYAVKSGQLMMPGVVGPAEHAVMQKLVSTYGKTWHTWQSHKGDTLPLGVPSLMMSFTADGQAHRGLMQERDQRLDVSTGDTRQQRANIPHPGVAAGANAWRDGRSVQVRPHDVPVRNLPLSMRPGTSGTTLTPR